MREVLESFGNSREEEEETLGRHWITGRPFWAISKICLNNWHYIRHKVLSFNDGINIFTGHSGSGKSTVIDALQIVLYANTDGRGFFNKAAADDSDRSLIEYLRGMINIGEDNRFSYLRNQNFFQYHCTGIKADGHRGVPVCRRGV